MFDLAVIGSGFAGSLLAMIARRLGRSVVLLDRHHHPRFGIGESSTPLANLLLRELAARYDLPRVLPLTQWGSWQKVYPQIGCGLKRGFSFFYHREDQRFQNDPEHHDQLLVTANLKDPVADTHWYRADFDHFLVQEAERCGVELMEDVALTGCAATPTGFDLRGRRGTGTLRLKARLIIDASGPRGFLYHQMKLNSVFEGTDTAGLYSHFWSARRLEELPEFNLGAPPFPIDDAAVHHVFDGGWIWVLRFNNGITSAGAAVGAELARELGFAEGSPAWQRLLRRYPSIADQLGEANAVEPFRHTAPLGFRATAAAGRGWALLPSAAGFVDPLLSTGFPLTLLGIKRLAAMIEAGWGQERMEEDLAAYSRQTLSEIDATVALIRALYENMDRWPVFSAITLLYFAAAIYSETAFRLGESERAQGFLLRDDPQFGPAASAALDYARRRDARWSSTEARDRILAALARVNLASLGEKRFAHWYPLTSADIARGDRRFREIGSSSR